MAYYLIRRNHSFCNLLFAVCFFCWLLASGLACAEMADYYSEPGVSPYREQVKVDDASDYVDPFTGKLQLHHTDILLPGNGGMDIAIARSYTSSNYGSIAGIPLNTWTMHLGRVSRPPLISICSHGGHISNKYNPVFELSDGSQQVLTDSNVPSSYLFISARLWKASCAPNANGLIVTSPEGTVYEMTYNDNTGNNVWYVQKITDRNGNWLSVSYINPNANGAKISYITASDGRSLTFNYVMKGSYAVLDHATDDSGRTWRYTHMQGPSSADWLLTEVELPNGDLWQYSYYGNTGTSPGSYQLKEIVNPQGGVISYTYQFVYFYTALVYPVWPETVVSDRSKSDAGIWHYAFTPGLSISQFDYTTVTGPSGYNVTYKHFGVHTGSPASQVSYAWQIGLLYEKTIGTSYKEEYEWSPLQLSTQNYQRSWGIDEEFNAPLLSKKTITLDGATYTTSYSNFDGYGNPGTVVESGPNGGLRTSTIAYAPNISTWILHLESSRTDAGGATTRTYDLKGNMLSVTRDGVKTSYTYDSQGNIATTTHPRGLTYTYSSYKRGIPGSEVQPEGITIARTVSDAGNVLSLTNGNGKITQYTYDALNRVTSIVHPAGNQVTIEYSPTIQVATRGPLQEVVRFNNFGRPLSVNLGGSTSKNGFGGWSATTGGITQIYGYDALWRKTFESHPNSTTSGTWFQYDSLDRVTKTTRADGSFQGTSYGAGTATITDERGKTTTYTYRAYGDPAQQFLMSVVAPVASANVTLTRNARDLVTTAVQGGITRTYGYDGNYYLTSVINPETGTTTYGRDAAGNMTLRAVGASGTTTYVYDGQNRLTSTTYPGATAVTRTYTKTNKLAAMTSAAATRSYSYDSNDNLTSESLLVDGLTLNAGYGYNSNDQLASTTYPYSNVTVNYSPDVLGRPTAISGYVGGVTYWPSGQVNQINYSNGVVSSYGQNAARLWPNSFVTKLGTSTPYINNSYVYDYTGNLTSVSDTVDTNYNRTFSYDNINRLTGVTGPWGAGSVSYNGVGNILGQAYGTANLSYAYDAQNRLSSVSGNLRNASYTYDSYGDITADGTGKTFTYDGAPNLTCFNCADSATKIAYLYDGANERVSVTKGGIKTYEFYSNDDKLLAEYTPSQANKLVEYIYLGGKRIAQRVTSGSSGSGGNNIAAILVPIINYLLAD